MRECSVENCHRPSTTRGWCKNHYERQRTRGTIDLLPPKDYLGTYRGREVPGRDSECWPWVGSMKKDGYGLHNYRRDGRRTSQNAHRAVYEMLVGPIPDGMQLDHLCRNPSCVNPGHLDPVTNGENVRRGLTSRGVFACGHPVSDENTIQTKTTRRCRTCLRARDAAMKRRWRAEHPDRMRAANQQYYAKNAETLKERQRQRRQADHADPPLT